MGSDSPWSAGSESDRLKWIKFVALVRGMSPDEIKVMFGLLQVIKSSRGPASAGGAGGVTFLKVSN